MRKFKYAKRFEEEKQQLEKQLEEKRLEYEKLLKERIEILEKQLKQRDLLLDHISHKCEQNAKTNWNGNPSIGFRQIQELSKTFM